MNGFNFIVYFLTGSTGFIGLYFINFFRKLMKTKIYPDNPVNPVYFKNIIKSIPFHKSRNRETLLVLCSKHIIFKHQHSLRTVPG
jgi:hypothetical protein